MIFIDPSRLRFATNPRDVRNFDQMQLDQEFPNRNPDGTTKTAASVPTPSPVPGFAPVGGIAPLLGTIHVGTTTVFNLNALPPDVVQRFSDHANLDKMLSKSDIEQFSKVASCKDPADPLKTIQVDQLYYIDGGFRLIARNGALFDLNPQGNDGTKQFHASFPTLANHDHSTIVRWYKLVAQVAAAHGMYVHPYECFRTDLLTLLALLVGKTASIVLVND